MVIKSQTESEIAAIKTRVDEYEKRIKEMDSMVTAIPEVEAELAKLNRGYKITKETYDQLVQRRSSAQISRDAEQTADESQFNIIEPPTIPLNPISPNRFILISAALFFGVFSGVGLAILLEQIKPTFYTRGQIEEVFNKPVLGSVSMFWSEKELIRRRREIIIFSFITLLFISSYIFVLIINKDVFIEINELFPFSIKW